MGFKVFYDCIVTFNVHLNLDYHTFELKKRSVALLHYAMYTLTTDTEAHMTPLLLMPPAKRWEIILHTARVFVAPTRGVLFKILTPPSVPNGASCHNRIRPKLFPLLFVFYVT